MNFEDPGELFLKTRHSIESVDDLLGFAEYLRVESGINGQLPVDLNSIIKRFGAPPPMTIPLQNIQGLFLGFRKGQILINSDDPYMRQRFTLAHEIAETLATKLPSSKNLIGEDNRFGGFTKDYKENICNRIAANLLMPPNIVTNLINQYGVSFQSARLVAEICDVSLTAALIQLVNLSRGNHFVILWQLKNKESELGFQKNNQLTFNFGKDIQSYPKKIRIEWVIGNNKRVFIPKEKSIGNNTLIYQAWESGKYQSGEEKLTFNNRDYHWYYTENQPININSEKYVLSLLTLLNHPV